MATRLLLDTRVWLWLNGWTDRLKPATFELLRAPDTETFLSAASTWEIAIKAKAGRLRLPMAPERYIPLRMTQNRIAPLPIQQAHTWRAAGLPLHHKDPFDRMLVAQAQMEGLKLLTADVALAAYAVDILPA